MTATATTVMLYCNGASFCLKSCARNSEPAKRYVQAGKITFLEERQTFSEQTGANTTGALS